MVVGARQSLQFFREITWFLWNNRALPKFRYRILHNLISITKLQKNHSIKANFKLTRRATLNKFHCTLHLVLMKKCTEIITSYWHRFNLVSLVYVNLWIDFQGNFKVVLLSFFLNKEALTTKNLSSDSMFPISTT